MAIALGSPADAQTMTGAAGDGEGAAARRRRRARLVLAVGVCLGLAYLGYRTLTDSAPPGGGMAVNFEVYRAAAADVWAGGTVYGGSPIEHAAHTYRYPPVWLAWFSLYLLVPATVGYGLHVVTALGSSVILGLAIADELERHGVEVGLVDRALAVGFPAVGSYAAPSLFFGNVNHHLALAVGIGLIWLARDRERRAGVALGLAALLKVFPAGIGLWLLRRRSWRAIGAAVATGFGGLALGAVAFGFDRTMAFVDQELLSRATPESVADGIAPHSEYVSLVRPLSALLPDVGIGTLTVLAALLVAPVLLVLYRDVDAPTRRVAAVFGTLAAILLVLTSFSLYFAVLCYPLVVLLYVLESGPGRLFALGAGISLLTLKLPDVETVVEAVPLPAVLAEVILALARVIYTFGTPVLWGTLAMLAACVWYVRASGRPSTHVNT